MRKKRRRRVSDSSTIDEELVHEDAAVASTGNVSATFRVAGLVSIPCDGAAHNFAIVELRPQATMSWVAVLKREPKTHLTVRGWLYAACSQTNLLQAHITNSPSTRCWAAPQTYTSTGVSSRAPPFPP
jgi:hypothetical protein